MYMCWRVNRAEMGLNLYGIAEPFDAERLELRSHA